MTSRKKKSIVFIGAGNLASHLSNAFFIAGHNILQVFSRTKESAKQLADHLNTAWTNDTAKILVGADVYVIALSDYHPVEAQTGPAVRNDQNVIKKHLDLLSFLPEIQHLYDVVSHDIIRLHQSGLT